MVQLTVSTEIKLTLKQDAQYKIIHLRQVFKFDLMVKMEYRVRECRKTERLHEVFIEEAPSRLFFYEHQQVNRINTLYYSTLKILARENSVSWKTYK